LPDQALEARKGDEGAALRERERAVTEAEARAEALLDQAASDIDAQEAELGRAREALLQQTAAFTCALLIFLPSWQPSCSMHTVPRMIS
jgi:hypothetical protein